MIRKAEENDIDAIMEIYNHAVRNTTATFDTVERTRSQMEELFFAHTGKYLLLVEEEAGSVRGYASLSRYRERKAFDGSVEISLYIDERYRHQGIGTGLMQELLAFANTREDIHTIISLITYNNKTSIHLHEKYGFTYCGQIKDAGQKFGEYLHLNIYQMTFHEKGQEESCKSLEKEVQ